MPVVKFSWNPGPVLVRARMAEAHDLRLRNPPAVTDLCQWSERLIPRL
jgi:hypothetical protein